MNVDVATQIVIACPVDVVSAYATDPSNAPDWYVNIDSVDWKTPPPVQIGSRVEFVARFLGRTIAVHLRVRGTRPRRTSGHAHPAGSVPDGDHLHLGSQRRTMRR